MRKCTAAVVMMALFAGTLQAGLVAWWKLDEGSGSSVADSSTNSWPAGEVKGTVEWGAPENGGGLHIDPDTAGTYVKFAGLNIGGSNAMSIAFWAKDDVVPDYTATQIGFWGVDGSGTARVKGYLPVPVAANDNRYWVQFFSASSAKDELYYVSTVEERQARAGEWHHWVFLKDAGQNKIEIYMDGLRLAANWAVNDIGSIVEMRVGGNSALSNAYRGYLKDFRIYDHALAGHEIAAILGVTAEEGMIAWWKFDEGSGRIIADSSTNNWAPGLIQGSEEWGAEEDGGGFHFDYPAAAKCVDFTGLDIGGGDAMSIAFWAKDDVETGETATEIIFWGFDAASASRLKGYFPYPVATNDNRYQVNFYSSSGTYDSLFYQSTFANRQALANSWHHWVFQKDAQQNQIEIYLDGVLVASGAGNSDISSLAKMSIGGNGDPTNPYRGYLKDFRIYNRELSESEIGTIISTMVGSGYAGWAIGWGVDIGSETDDYDGDGLSNLGEFGLGGNPTNALDQGTAPQCGIVDVGGTSYFGYLYPQLTNTDSGLTYSLEVCTDLVNGTWTNVGTTVYGTNVTGGDLDIVTNFTDTVDSQKFVRLLISN